MRTDERFLISEQQWMSAVQARQQEHLPLFGAYIFLSINESDPLYLGHNLVVNSASVLLARLIKQNTEPNAGFSFLAVGTGDPSWSVMSPPSPTKDLTKLETEIARVPFTSNFVDTATGQPVTDPTNTVDFLASFGPGVGTGSLLEMGVFGGDANISVDTGTLVSAFRFPIKVKSASDTFSWTIRYTTISG